MGIFIQNQGTLGVAGRGSLSIFGDYATAVVASSDDGTKYLTLTSEPPELACFFLGNFTIQSNWSMCFSFKTGLQPLMVRNFLKFTNNSTVLMTFSFDISGCLCYNSTRVSQTLVCDNEWHSINLVFVFHSVLFITVDGKAQGDNWTGTLFNNTVTCRFINKTMSLCLDDIRVYDYALTPTQMNSIMDPSKFLKIHYTFDTWTSDLGSTVPNEGSLGSSYNGVLTNSVLTTSDCAVGSQCLLLGMVDNDNLLGNLQTSGSVDLVAKQYSLCFWFKSANILPVMLYPLFAFLGGTDVLYLCPCVWNSSFIYQLRSNLSY